MSSFSNPHYMYLFDLKNGKQKLAYGESPEDALDILSIRLSEAEMGERYAAMHKILMRLSYLADEEMGQDKMDEFISKVLT